MIVPLTDLRLQYGSIQEEIDAAISAVLRRAEFVLGSEVEAFETEFAAYCGVRHCVGVGSGTDALALALQGLGVGTGDEVITVSHTFFATAEAITSLGAVPRFAEVRDDTLLMDVASASAQVGPRTRAIVPVHLYGTTVDLGPILDLAAKRGLAVVEDAAQAHGARYLGKRTGSFGRAAAFSFFPTKNLGAYGDGGAVLTDDASLAEWLRKARNHGRSAKYEHDFEGRNSRLDSLQAAVLRAKLRHLDDWNAHRRIVAAEYDRLLESIPGIRRVGVTPGCEPVHHLYVVRLPDRDAVLRRLRADGVEAGVHYPIPAHLQPALRRLGLAPGALPVTERAAKEVISLPMYPELTAEACQRVVALLG